jgi:hypothetical protein
MPSFFNIDTVSLKVFDWSNSINFWAKAMSKSWVYFAITFFLVDLFSTGEDTEFLSWVFGASLGTFGLCAIFCASFSNCVWWDDTFSSFWVVCARAFFLSNILFTCFDALIVVLIGSIIAINNWSDVFDKFGVPAFINWVQLGLISFRYGFLISSIHRKLCRLGSESLFIIILSWFEGYEYIPVGWEKELLRELSIFVNSDCWRSSCVWSSCCIINPFTIFLTNYGNSSTKSKSFDSDS